MTLEDRFLALVHAEGWPEPEREVRLIDGRRFRCDFCWREARLVVEVEGGSWVNGRHTRGAGFASDCWKYNTLALDGWRVLRVTAAHLKYGSAQRWLSRALMGSRKE